MDEKKNGFDKLEEFITELKAVCEKHSGAIAAERNGCEMLITVVEKGFRYSLPATLVTESTPVFLPGRIEKY